MKRAILAALAIPLAVITASLGSADSPSRIRSIATIWPVASSTHGTFWTVPTARIAASGGLMTA